MDDTGNMIFIYMLMLNVECLENIWEFEKMRQTQTLDITSAYFKALQVIIGSSPAVRGSHGKLIEGATNQPIRNCAFNSTRL